MKRILTLLAVVFTIGLSTVATDAEAAKRMGSGKSLGTQRQATADKAPGTPAQSAAAPAAGAAGAAAAAPKRSWMGPLAGLAAGLGLAALASHLGFGEELASMLMMGLVAVAVMAAIAFFMRKRAAAQAAASGAGTHGMQYAHANPANTGNGRDTRGAIDAPAYKVSMPEGGRSAIGSAIGSGIGSGIGAGVAPSSIPADFDKAGFERNAKVNFIRLQAANDAGNLDDIRQFTTPEMFAEIKMDIQERGGANQKSDVVNITAQVTEVNEDADRYLVSVRFTGLIRDEADQSEESFDEIWHMMKPRLGNQGWVLAGIQQTQ